MTCPTATSASIFHPIHETLYLAACPCSAAGCGSKVRPSTPCPRPSPSVEFKEPFCALLSRHPRWTYFERGSPLHPGAAGYPPPAASVEIPRPPRGSVSLAPHAEMPRFSMGASAAGAPASRRPDCLLDLFLPRRSRRDAPLPSPFSPHQALNQATLEKRNKTKKRPGREESHSKQES